jgi:hypothetical protein
MTCYRFLDGLGDVVEDREFPDHASASAHAGMEDEGDAWDE